VKALAQELLPSLAAPTLVPMAAPESLLIVRQKKAMKNENKKERTYNAKCKCKIINTQHQSISSHSRAGISLYLHRTRLLDHRLGRLDEPPQVPNLGFEVVIGDHAVPVCIHHFDHLQSQYNQK
jgi:hypothetical protein